jgi:hypothetical protein
MSFNKKQIVAPEFPDYGEDDYKRIVYHPKTILFGDDDHIEYNIIAQFSTPSGTSRKSDINYIPTENT